MKSDGANGRSWVKLDSKKAQILKRKFKDFKQIYDDQQSKFTTSSDFDYYIVSTAYLKEWTQFCASNQPERLEPRPMNEDLMDAGGQLRKGLAESKDFQIVNEKVFSLLKADKGFQLKRSAIFVGKEKRVPIYLDHIRYLKLDHKDVHAIDYKKIHADDLKIKIVEISIQDTIERMLKKIKQQENIGTRYKLRVWKNNIDDYSLSRVFKYIKEKTEKISYYRFDGIGKLIDNEETVIQDLTIEPNDYFIVEVSDEYSTWFFKSADEAKCQGCYKYKKLPYVCGCKVVAYCTIECQEKDKRYHIKDCKYAEEQELNEQIQMKIKPNSSLGRVGLSNLGNTCFMNSCLQCLSNTTLLTDYFLGKYFDKEINKENPLGSKGRLARNYAKFIKNMWCQSQSVFSPHNLKGAVGKLNPIFLGYAQHDSQQFFSFLVDGLHEDLNRVLKKPYVQSVDSKNRKDEIVAMESWIAYTQRNQSIIVDLLTGQYKSKVICPECQMQSITFDPFTTVSLPIPEEPVVSQMKFYVIFSDNEKEALRMSFQYTKSSTKEWLETATAMLKRNSQDFAFYVLTVMENIYPFESSSKAEIIHKVEEENKNVFLLQLSEQEKKIKERVQLVTRLCKKSYHFNQYDNLWFKRPFFFQKSTTKVAHIYSRIFKYLFPTYNNKKQFKTYQDYQAKMLADKPCTLVLKYKKSLERYYGRVETKFDKQMVLDKMDEKLEEILKEISVNDCQLDVRFSKDTVKLFEFQKLKKCSDGEEKTLKKSSYKEHATSVTLDECFRVFQEKEQLEPGNEWYCPNCKEHRLATKEMTIYKAPEILILHLKRFKNKGTYRKEKNQTSVQFPLLLNLSKYVIDPKPMSSYNDLLKKQQKYLQPSFAAEFNPNSAPEYQLYAISNHYGGLGGGHYTAYGKNKDKWYEFNDSSVHAASESDLKGSGAYMLFYRRVDSMKIR